MKYLQIVDHHATTIVSTDDLKTHLRITYTDDDTYIAGLEKAAVHRLEEFTNLLLINTTIIQYGFEFSDLETLFKGPYYTGSSAVVSSYVNSAWLDITNKCEIITASLPMRIYQKADESLPSPDDVKQKYKVSYQVGWRTPSEIPEPIIQAIKIMVADMYENRQSVIVGKQVSEIPKTAEYLMMPYKIQTL